VTGVRRTLFSVLCLSILALALPAPAMGCDVCDPEWQVIEDGFEMLPSAPAAPDALPPDPAPQEIEDPIEVIPEDMRPAAEPSPTTSTTAPPAVDHPARVVRIIHRRPAFGPATRIPI
jgi:hypothetical protein